MLPAALTGWAPASDLRDLAQLPTDEASRRAQIVADAWRFVGVPYLWGGCTALGIDCSGFAQLLHRLAGVILPRDADMQYFAGPVRSNSLTSPATCSSSASRRRHLPGPRSPTSAISLGGWRIIHSSRSRNGVYEDDVQAVPHLRESLVGARTWVTG